MSSKKSKVALKFSPSPLVERGAQHRIGAGRGEDLIALKTLKKLNSPQKIQDYLDKLPFNFEEGGESYWSPVEVLKRGKAHCFEGACLAAAAIYLNGLGRPLLMDLKIQRKYLKDDADHTLALFKQNGLWGAISKTNHAVLRYRDPIYKSVRELALSYFHEYFMPNGYKVLESYSEPFDVSKQFGDGWIESEDELDEVAEALDKAKHQLFYPPEQKRLLRKATEAEIRYGAIEIFKKKK